MSNVNKVRWLHISDFHFRGDDSYNRDVVLNSLLLSLPDLVKRHGTPHFIFATGDIANSGKQAEYAPASAFFDKILETLGLTKDRLFVIPGNHDVDRSSGKGLVRELSRDDIDEYFDPSEPLYHVTRKQRAFLEWHNSYFSGIRSFPENTTCAKVESFCINDEAVCVLPINSAAFCIDDDDSGKLFVGNRCVDSAIASMQDLVPTPTLRIALIHHPLNWLNPIEATNIKFSLRHNFDCILSGHLHETDIESRAGNDDAALYLAAGATYQSASFPKTAMFCSYVRPNVTVSPIRFEPSPTPLWTIDPSAFPRDSRFEGHFALEGKVGQPAEIQEIETTIDVKLALSAHDLSPKPDVKGSFEEDLFRAPNGEVLYAEPRLMDKPQKFSIDEDNAAVRIEMSDFIRDANSVVIEVRPESGGSNLCKRIEFELAKVDGFICERRDARDLPNYRKKLEPLFASIKNHLSKKVIVLDNVILDKDDRLIKEINHLKVFSRIILVVTNRAPVMSDFADQMVEIEGFKKLYLWGFSREDIRTATSTLFGSADQALISQIVGKIYSDLLALCIPLTPTNIIMYLRILHREGQFQPINRVDLVGRYLQETLQSPAEAYKDTFNVKNKIDVLSSFVYKLYCESRYSFDDAYWFSFIAEYQRGNLFEFDGVDFLNELIRVRIFGRWNASIYIKYSFFFNFFLGKNLVSKPKLMCAFLEGEEYLRVAGVVEVISGLSSDNQNLLETLSAHLQKDVEAFSDKYIDAGFDPFREARWGESAEEEKTLWKPVSDQVEAGPRKTSEIDLIKSSFLAEARTQDQIIYFSKFSAMEHNIFIIEGLVKDALRNGDDVPAESKVKAYKAILAANLIAFQIGALFAPVICKKAFFRWHGVAFLDFDKGPKEGGVDGVSKEEKIFETIYALCSSIAKQSAEQIATVKLAPLFRTMLRGVDQELGFEDLVAFECALTARGPKWAETLEEVITKADRRSYYLLICLNKMVRTLRNEILQTRDRESIKRLITIVQTKRMTKKQNPGERAIKAIATHLKDTGYPPLAEKKSGEEP